MGRVGEVGGGDVGGELAGPEGGGGILRANSGLRTTTLEELNANIIFI